MAISNCIPYRMQIQLNVKNVGFVYVNIIIYQFGQFSTMLHATDGNVVLLAAYNCDTM